MHGNTYSNSYAKLYYKDSNTNETIIAENGFNSSDQLLIPGPCELKVHNGRSGYWTTTLIKVISKEVETSTAKYASVIPENAKTNVSVIL